MPLPILQGRHAATTDDLVRLFHRSELHWARHLGEEASLDVGTAIVNASLAGVWEANRVLDAALPDGTPPADALAEADAHYAAAGARCAQWTMNPSAPPGRTAPLVEHLLAAGWHAHRADILHLVGLTEAAAAADDEGAPPGPTIIPARASFRHARALAEAAAARWGQPQLAEARMLHLDDPHWDALLALRDGDAVAGAGVLAVGDIGRIDGVFVAEPYRRLGIGRTMMRRALDVCARSLFKHVMLCVEAGNGPAIALYGQLGFRKIGQIVSYRAPWTAGA